MARIRRVRWPCRNFRPGPWRARVVNTRPSQPSSSNRPYSIKRSWISSVPRDVAGALPMSRSSRPAGAAVEGGPLQRPKWPSAARHPLPTTDPSQMHASLPVRSFRYFGPRVSPAPSGVSCRRHRTPRRRECDLVCHKGHIRGAELLLGLGAQYRQIDGARSLPCGEVTRTSPGPAPPSSRCYPGIHSHASPIPTPP